jgi:hypothetical protein
MVIGLPFPEDVIKPPDEKYTDDARASAAFSGILEARSPSYPANQLSEVIGLSETLSVG